MEVQKNETPTKNKNKDGYFFSPKHNSNKLQKSRKRLGFGIDSTENLLSDMSMEIADITMEVEKLNRGCGNPEQNMKDTNRLLQEIDHQMEMSFEIMEDRQSMVRQFLKDRENADRNHHQRAANMMSQFNQKISAMESYLNVKGLVKKVNQTSMTQTDVIQTSNAEQQTCFEEVLPGNQDMQEVVKSFTKDMREVLQKQLMKEKQAILVEFEAGRQALNPSEIEELLFKINEKLKHKKVNKRIADLLNDKIDPVVVKDDLPQQKDDLVERLVMEDDVVIYDVPNVSDDIKENEKPSSEFSVSELKSSIRQLDSLEASLNSILNNIRQKLGIDEVDILNLIQDIIENETEKSVHQMNMQEVVSHVIRNYAESNLSESNDIKSCDLIHEYVTLKADVCCAERNLEEVLTKAFPHCEKELIKTQVLDNDKARTQRETAWQDLMDRNNSSLLDNFTMNSAPDWWMKNSFITNETIEMIKPKLGEKLCHALFKSNQSSNLQAVEYVHYQDKTIDEILKDYEEEIFRLRNDYSESKAYQEVTEIMSGGGRDVVKKMKEEWTQTKDALRDHIPTMQCIKEELQRLKTEKDKLTETEENMISKLVSLQLRLERLDKDIVDHFLAGQRQKEKVDLELQIAGCTDEIQKVETKLASVADESTADTSSTTQEKQSLSAYLTVLKDDLQKLIPYINRNSCKYGSSTISECLPDSAEISCMIETRHQLSKKLIETENNIQEIITSNGYESSEDEDSCFQSEPGQFTDVDKISFQIDNTHASLNEQLRGIEVELGCVSQQMEMENIKVEDIKGLKITSEKLNKALSDIEEQLKLQSGSTKKELERIKSKAGDLKTKLKEGGVDDFEYHESKMENLLKTKLQLDEKLHGIIERVTEDRETRRFIGNSMKQLIVAGDRAKNSILNLEEDIRKMTEIKGLTEHANITDQLIDTEKHILQTKSEGFNKVISLAYQKLNRFLIAIKEQATKKFIEFNSTEGKKEELNVEQKNILLRELETIIEDISNTMSDLTSIEEFRSKRVISNNSMSLMKTISQKRNELLSNLEDIDRCIESNVSGTDEVQLKQTLDQKVELKLELSELEEKVDIQETALKGRLEKLIELKFALERKFYDSITIDDFKTVLNIFEEENEEMREGDVNKLMTKRAELTDKIFECLERKDCQETGLLFKELDKIDSEVNVTIRQITMKQESVNLENPIEIFVKKDELMEILQGRKELRNILNDLKLMEREDVDEKSIRRTYEVLQEAEELRASLKNFQKRSLDFHHLDIMKELKDLNEKKINALLRNIKQMNLFIERGRKAEQSKEQSDTPGSTEIQEILSNSEKINQELDDVESSYLEEMKTNESVFLAKPCVKEFFRKPTTLDSYLQDRENKLNRLFLVMKCLEKNAIDDLERRELEKEKGSLENVIEEIDEKIIQGDFEDDSSLETPTRSFSPRSTSSRNSMTYVLDEREQLMKHIFQLQKKEDFLRESEDILNKQSTLKDVQERKERLCRKLKVLDERINHVKDFSEDDDTVVDDIVVDDIANESINTTIHIADGDEYEHALQELRHELNGGQFHPPSNTVVCSAISSLLNDSKEIEIVKAVQELDERLHIENLKKKLKFMEEKQIEITQNMKKNKASDVLRVQARKKRKALAWITEKIKMISKRNELETSVTEIQILLQTSGGESNGNYVGESGKSGETIEFPRGKDGMSIKELKRDKVAIEKQLDRINVMIHQYSNALESKINSVEREIESKHTQEENISNYKQMVETLKIKKNDLENRALKIQEMVDQVNNTSLMDLLTQRRLVAEEITQVDGDCLSDVKQEKYTLAVSLKKYFDEYRHCIQWQHQLESRLKILSEKIENMENSEDDENLVAMETMLGKKLFEILSDKEKIPEEKYLQNLLCCLEDRTVSDYIKEISTLCSIQNEQIEELKVKESESKDRCNQISQLEHELIQTYEKLYSAEELRKSMKEKLGGKLFDILMEDKDGGDNSANVDGGGHFERVRKLIKESEESLETALQKNYFDLYDKNNNIVDEVTRENERLKTEIGCSIKEIQLLRSREDEFCSETESLRDNLQQCAQKTNTINEQAAKLKKDYEHTKEKLESLTKEYEQLKFDYDEVVHMVDEHEKMKSDMLVASDKYEELKNAFTSKEIETNEICLQLSELRIALKESQDKATKSNEEKVLAQTELRNLQDEARMLNEKLKCLRTLDAQEKDSSEEVWSERLKGVTDALQKSYETMEKSQDDRLKLQEDRLKLQEELEGLKKKFKKMTKEKMALQESLENESKSLLKVEDELATLKQKEKFSNREMHKHCQLIERHEKDLRTYKTQTSSLEKQNTDLQNSLNEIKEKYQALSIKHQNEAAKASKELRVVKNKMEEQRGELEKMKSEGEDVREDDLRRLTEALEAKQTELEKLRHQMIEMVAKKETDNSELLKRNVQLEENIEDLSSENKTLLKKLRDLDESFEIEISDTRREMSEKYGKSIDKLNEKIRHMTDELNTLEKLKDEEVSTLEKSKDEIEKENKELKKEIVNLRKLAKEREMIVETELKGYRVKESSISVELEAMKLENNELQEQILELKQQTRKAAYLERSEKELNEKNKHLKMATLQLEQERQQFDRNVCEHLKRFVMEDQKNQCLEDRVSLDVLKTTQNERDKISNELIDTKRELMHLRNELRKIKLLLRQKEDEYIAEQKKMLSTFEEEQKNKAEEMRRVHSKEKETLLKMYTEERSKWEEEMKILKHNLQEENLRKLSEQRNDFESELEVQLEKYLKQNADEIDELQDQVDVLKNQKVELISQFEKEKTNMKKTHEEEIHSLEETVRRLLNNLVKFKEKKKRLRHNHQDEILELEERFDAERERLEERREHELETLKVKLQKSHNVGLHSVKTILNSTLEDLVTEATRKYDPVKSAMSKFTLEDLKELLHMGDLSDILDSEYEAEQDMIKESVRSQYKTKLRNETDALLKRLLELSEELDSLRGYS